MNVFAHRLLDWHECHGRHGLPWQCDDPYRVWVSEVMLQQTRVDAVVPYFERFIERFPDVSALAAAESDEVLAHWSGLGYYARARNLHAAARIVCDTLGGEFPRDLDGWMALPGVGRSTAGAVLSMAFDSPHPILDGNAKRVLARHAGIEGWPGERGNERHLWRIAGERTPPERAAAYTRAIMDLGATLCTRTAPACGDCPVTGDCVARISGRTADIPAPRPRRDRPLRETQMLLLEDGHGALFLERRPPSGVWGGLWCPPQVAPGVDVAGHVRHAYGLEVDRCESLEPVRHGFTHFVLDIRPVRARVRAAHRCSEDGSPGWKGREEIESLGLPAPVRSLIIDTCPGRSTA